MGIPVASVLMLIFILWLQYEIRKGSKVSKKTLDLFWLKEQNSNKTRRRDISHLEYLSVNLEQLPLEDHEDDTINSYRDTIIKYADRKMLNLSGKTNTELKSEYGVGNFNLLSSYDSNYTIFVSMLQKWAGRLKEHGYTADAQAVLEFSIFSCLTDVTGAYRMLNEIYQAQNRPDKTDALVEALQKTKHKEKEKLVKELKSISPST